MRKNNGRRINVVSKKYKANRVPPENRQTPYTRSNGSNKSRGPEIYSLADDKIGKCLGSVELALRRSNKAEAIAAIERAFFVEEPRSAITGRSHLEELKLRDSFVDLLNRHNIYTISDLLLVEIVTLRKLAGRNEDEADSLVLVVENLGFRFSDSDVDD